MCTVDPESSPLHAEVSALAKRVSDHVIPKTRGYHEIWYGEQRVASSEPEEPFYGPTYMPRKFKIGFALPPSNDIDVYRSEEHTSELQSLMRISYAVFCLNKKKMNDKHQLSHHDATNYP